jgi:DNA uptake protein ComE-like DNA-binding protein
MTASGDGVTGRPAGGVQRPAGDPAPSDLERLPTAWAAVPVLSLGILSWAPFLYAAVRTRARKFQIAAGIYLSLAIVAGVLVAASDHSHGALNELAGLLLIMLAGAGCVHTLSIRNEFGRQLALADDPRLLVAEQRADLRERALKLAREDPQRAISLGVGRPDVPGAFDGGLVDVNHAGAETLATLPGIDADHAQRIVELRAGGGGFESLADLDLVLDLNPDTLSELKAHVVFLPRA